MVLYTELKEDEGKISLNVLQTTRSVYKYQNYTNITYNLQHQNTVILCYKLQQKLFTQTSYSTVILYIQATSWDNSNTKHIYNLHYQIPVTLITSYIIKVR